MAVKLPRNYQPSDDEPFMNAKQREYFRRHLLSWREELLRDTNNTLQNLQQESLQSPDIADRASAETDRAVELRTRDRERKLVQKIDEALEIIDGAIREVCP